MSTINRHGIIMPQYLILVIIFLSYCVQENKAKIESAENNEENVTISHRSLKIQQYISITASVPDIPDEGDDTKSLKSGISLRSLTPNHFDARQNWPHCRNVIGHIRDQGSCASCWAISSASTISDRICIGSKGAIQVEVSVEDILSCCFKCTMQEDRCTGGYGWKAMRYWLNKGVVSGGEVNSRSGCKPCSVGIYKHKKVPDCLKQCTNPDYKKPYNKDKHYASEIYRIKNNQDLIQTEILNNGPVLAYMVLYKDFYGYKGGVYRRRSNDRGGNHFVKIIGWGVEAGEKYWLVSNSWGTDWGLGGFFKIVRGENMNVIESEIRGGKLRGSGKFRQMTIQSRGTSDRYMSPLVTCVYLTLLLLFHIVQTEI